jgi:tetratricopeptide (TPR) repeat protein
MRRRQFWVCGLACAFVGPICCSGQAAPARTQTLPSTSSAHSSREDHAREELRTGTQLTRSGALRDAIPHLLTAQSAGLEPYATGVNLAICYVGTGAIAKAIPLLESLRASGYRTTVTATLLVQAYIAAGRASDAYAQLTAAAEAAPNNETIFAYAADACTDHRQYALGLRMMNLGLATMPASPRLHYERALFLAEQGSLEDARPEFDRAAQLDPGGYIGYLAHVQKDLYDGELKPASQLLEQAIRSGHRDYRMLSLLGSVLLQEGVAPGDPRLPEAQSALEESAKERPDFSATQVALGRLYLMLGRNGDAAEHLEIARALEPENPAVYTSLAAAYRGLGQREKAAQMTAALGRLLARQAPQPAAVKTATPH